MRRASGAASWSLAIAVCASALAGCQAHRWTAAPFRGSVATDEGEFHFEYGEKDRAARKKVEEAIRSAGPKLAQWGNLNEPVQVFILPSHAALEAACGRNGYEWLRAWTRYDEIFLQSPRTWTVFGASQADVNELVLHELTHSVMYQQSADRTHWQRKGIPLWFREGMASYTANQGYRWPSLEDLAQFYDQNPERDPVLDPDPLYRTENGIVYGAAHHAFTFLVTRYGADGVREVLAQMRSGMYFADAFQTALHLDQKKFVSDFQRYVRLRGFKFGRVKKLLPSSTPK